MITRPTVLAADASVATVRAFFADDHKHAALLVDHGNKLVAVVERRDLDRAAASTTPARGLGSLTTRTTRPGADATVLLTAMAVTGSRRVAVVDEDGTLLGLLCLKRAGTGFCSDDDVRARDNSTRRAVD